MTFPRLVFHLIYQNLQLWGYKHCIHVTEVPRPANTLTAGIQVANPHSHSVSICCEIAEDTD
jgi:hypothetical protein